MFYIMHTAWQVHILDLGMHYAIEIPLTNKKLTTCIRLKESHPIMTQKESLRVLAPSRPASAALSSHPLEPPHVIVAHRTGMLHILHAINEEWDQAATPASVAQAWNTVTTNNTTVKPGL